MRRPAAAIALVLAAALLPSCGGSDDSTTAVKNFPLSDNRAGDAHVRYVADPGGKLAFNVSEASASPGKITLELVNSQSVAHNLALEGHDGQVIAETDTVSEAVTSTTAIVKPGVYVVYCTVPGHRKAGMTGHLTVFSE